MPQTASNDVISMLLSDHEQIKQLFSRFDTVTPSDRGDLFWELTNELVRHEVAEEEIIYPEVRKTLVNGDHLADERIKEQSEAEELLEKMEKAGADSEHFTDDLAKLRAAVLDHAEKEEQTVFTPLAAALDDDRRAQLASRYDKAKTAAPTHPHPHAPDTPPGNVTLGPVAALVDRARDAMHKMAS